MAARHKILFNRKLGSMVDMVASILIFKGILKDRYRHLPNPGTRMMRDYERRLLLPAKVMGETQIMANIESFNEKYGL